MIVLFRLNKPSHAHPRSWQRCQESRTDKFDQLNQQMNQLRLVLLSMSGGLGG